MLWVRVVETVFLQSKDKIETLLAWDGGIYTYTKKNSQRTCGIVIWKESNVSVSIGVVFSWVSKIFRKCCSLACKLSEKFFFLLFMRLVWHELLSISLYQYILQEVQVNKDKIRSNVFPAFRLLQGNFTVINRNLWKGVGLLINNSNFECDLSLLVMSHWLKSFVFRVCTLHIWLLFGDINRVARDIFHLSMSISLVI